MFRHWKLQLYVFYVKRPQRLGQRPRTTVLSSSSPRFTSVVLSAAVTLWGGARLSQREPLLTSPPPNGGKYNKQQRSPLQVLSQVLLVDRRPGLILLISTTPYPCTASFFSCPRRSTFAFSPFCHCCCLYLFSSRGTTTVTDAPS